MNILIQKLDYLIIVNILITKRKYFNMNNYKPDLCFNMNNESELC